ncbi:MAG: SDR family NAD(P)-dependent oxidoreductase [Rhodospirillales bacterium]
MTQGALAGTVAVITGAARGMGRAMAHGLAAAGAKVTLADLDAGELDGAVAEVNAAAGAGSAIAVAGDVTRDADVAAIVERTVAAFGTVGIVVNNAGLGEDAVRRDFMSRPVRFWEIEPAVWRRIMEVNANAAFLVSRAAAPHMIAQGWGRIVNVTTSLDAMIRGGFAPYGGSKASTEAHTAIMAADLEGTGVTANVLVPGGPVNTRMFPDDPRFPRDKLIQPDAMVRPIRWLASRASDGVTGHRFIAALWGHEDGPAEAAKAPAAWPQLGAQTVWQAH